MKNKSKLVKSQSSEGSKSIKDYFLVSKNLKEGKSSELKPSNNNSELKPTPVMPVSKSEDYLLHYNLCDEDDYDAFTQSNNINPIKRVKSDTFNTRGKGKSSKKAKTESEQFEIDYAIKVSKLTSHPETRQKFKSCQLLSPLEGRQLANSKLLDWLQTIPDYIPSNELKNDRKIIKGGELWYKLSFEKDKV
ncbi:hypothetical protein CONCODRAFT_138685 [Conidiobolus coronatus NRRL 28638]|uniref:Uncharacterized protein n=1 Tax=Conidiobolus coronatus (strain ATCC 28846 / CBS 209.66 / NRRL 28638) TaxID=796925 RepID=A0A137NSK1_CONC2|nr:hypothetical protein CONCODRAFT_138685 [Conidiobolus coronatus NRRL 28638]|eukprot:KXN65691.1 hypothetical protein CONCODRAFT_138685 [Conidiobolus coronatus NRRL 28638]